MSRDQIRPLYAWSGYRTNEVFFSRRPGSATNLIGEVNRGWTYITGALDLERGALTNAGDLRRALDELVSARPAAPGVTVRFPPTIRPSAAASPRPKPTSRSRR